MASAFVHATLDLVAFGRHHFDLHQRKDAPSQELGTEHRSLNHEWYNAFGLDWDFRNPFPDELHRVIENIADKHGDAEAESSMANVGHDYSDRVWDKLGERERQDMTGSCLWLVFHPDVLRERFGVDVVSETIQRTIAGKQIWEPAPGLAKDYKRLYQYARVVAESNPKLTSVLARYG